jgi:hypothetical protein
LVLFFFAVVVLLEEDLEEELPPSLPHAAIDRLAASTAAIVSIALSGVLLIGRAPVES